MPGVGVSRFARRERVADEEPLDSARRVNAQAVLMSRIVRPAEGRAGEPPACNTMLPSALHGQMLASKRYHVWRRNPTQTSSTVSSADPRDSLRALSDLLPGEYTRCRRSTFKGFVWCARGGRCFFLPVAPCQCVGHGGRTSRSASAARIRDRVSARLCDGACLSCRHHGNLSMYRAGDPEEA